MADMANNKTSAFSGGGAVNGWCALQMRCTRDAEAAKREVLEETGYSDLEIIEELPEVFYDNFYAAHKDVNRHITCHIVHGKLKSLAQNERDEKEKSIADVLWIDNNELPTKLTTEAHRYVCDQVLGTAANN